MEISPEKVRRQNRLRRMAYKNTFGFGKQPNRKFRLPDNVHPKRKPENVY